MANPPGTSMQNQLNTEPNSMISISDFTKGFEKDNLFENLSITIHSNSRIALVGGNGTGKTTLLKCLVGSEDFQGRITSTDIKISLMEQEKNFDNMNKTFADYIEEKNSAQEEKIKALELDLGRPEICEDEAKFNQVLNKYNLLITNASLDPKNQKLLSILKELEITEEILSQKISELSGGQKIKLRLAECLARSADLYLLDEPTNHLDLESIEWLENYIQANIKSLLVISHDRYFLNKIVDTEWEIENKTIKKYSGSYESYEKEKIKHLEILKRKFKDLTKRKEELLASAEEKYRWAAINRSAKLRALGDRLKRDSEKINPGPDPDKFQLDIEIKFSNKSLHNCEVFRLVDMTKKFGDKALLKNINSEINQGEKVAIIGGNGTGKTTILKLLTGKEVVSKGFIEKRSNLKIGYFDQELQDVDQNQTILKFLEKETSKNDQHIISILLNFGFSKKSFSKKISQLSGGEKGRLNLLRIANRENEILLLDEPTNNLDIYLKDSLEKAIEEFKGTVIFVSHDRHFIDNVATRILEIKDNQITSYSGNYTDYIEFKTSQN